MNCEHCESLLDQYLLGELPGEDKALLEAHLDGCARCRLRLRVLEDCRRLDEGDEVPVSFSSSWRQRIEEEEEAPMTQHKPVWRAWMYAAAALVLMVAGTWLTGGELNRVLGRPGDQAAQTAAYGGSQGPYAREESFGPSANFDMAAAPAPEVMRSMAAKDVAAQEEKIIRTLSIRTSTRRFDQDYQTIRNDLEQIGGRVESAEVRTEYNGLRTAYLTLRVPAGQLDAFAEKLKGLGTLQAISESSEDVSERYYDTASRLKTQQAKMERLTALMEKAASVEELISLESAIADTQYQIDSLTGQIQGMDSKVNDATLSLTLSEMSALDTAGSEGENLWQRIQSGVAHMWRMLKTWAADAAVFLVAALPVIIVIAVIALAIKAIVKRRNKK